MSKYTTELRFICEMESGLDESKGYNDVDTIVTAAAPKIFSFDFPIFDEAYRLPLEKKILKHYYTREISEETYGLWKLRLEDKMNLIMPYYNKLYDSDDLPFDPFNDTDITKEHDGTDGRTIGDSNTQWRLFSDTPQGGINGITNDEDSVANNTYLTDATKVTNNGTQNIEGEINFTETETGKKGTKSYSLLLEEYRKTFRRIDAELIAELEPLFFGLW